MSTIHKTIKINPELFKFSKTMKNKEKKEKPSIPFIHPNKLKHKLLNRIKEHKNNELKEKQQLLKNKNDISDTNTSFKDDFNDEFNDALTYLTDISKQNKNKGYGYNSSNKTLKNYDINTPYVELELPVELQEVKQEAFSNIQNIITNTNTTNDIMKLNYKVDSVVPYGILKNGQKPTYRTYNSTRKNNLSMLDSITNTSPNETNVNNNTPLTREEENY